MKQISPYQEMQQLHIRFEKDEYPEKNIIKNLYKNGQNSIDLVRQGDSMYILKRIKRSKVQSSKIQFSDQEEKTQISTPADSQSEADCCLKFKSSLKFSYYYDHKIIPQAQKGEDPYVVQIFDIFKTNDYLNIIMERCQHTLYDELIQDKICNQRPQLCVIYLLSMLYSLTACHMRGIYMHRDIKPQNFVVTHRRMEKKIKLIDFGVSSLSKQSKTYTGTELYQAIEVFAVDNQWVNYRYQRQYGYLPNCDIFSIGIISYHCYCGPLQGKNKLSFPFKENIYDLLEKAQSNKQRRAIIKKYYQDIVKYQHSLLSFSKWNYTGPNKQRMQEFQKLIQKMLQIDLKKRPTTLGMYELIQKNRKILFHGLEDLQVCKDFDQKYKQQQMYQTKEKFSHNLANQDTRLT